MATTDARTRGPFAGSRMDCIGDALMPRLPFALAGALLAMVALIPALPPAISCLAPGEGGSVAALVADGSLLLAALALAFLRRLPRTRFTAVSLATFGFFGALAATQLGLDAFRSDWPALILATAAGAFALGGLCIARCGSPSPELRLTLFAAYFGVVLAGALALALTPYLGRAAETAFCLSVLAVLVWRVVVLTLRDAW